MLPGNYALEVAVKNGTTTLTACSTQTTVASSVDEGLSLKGTVQAVPTLQKGSGTGNTCPDASAVGENFTLRAERSGKGDGRVYRVTFESKDPLGAACSATVKVCVPHDNRGTPCVEGAEVYDSLSCP